MCQVGRPHSGIGATRVHVCVSRSASTVHALQSGDSLLAYSRHESTVTLSHRLSLRPRNRAVRKLLGGCGDAGNCVNADLWPELAAFGAVQVLASQMPSLDAAWWSSTLGALTSFIYSFCAFGFSVAHGGWGGVGERGREEESAEAGGPCEGAGARGTWGWWPHVASQMMNGSTHWIGRACPVTLPRTRLPGRPRRGSCAMHSRHAVMRLPSRDAALRRTRSGVSNPPAQSTHDPSPYLALQALGAFAFAFAFPTVLVEVQDTLRTPPSPGSTMRRAIHASLGTAFLLYLAVAVSGCEWHAQQLGGRMRVNPLSGCRESEGDTLAKGRLRAAWWREPGVLRPDLLLAH